MSNALTSKSKRGRRKLRPPQKPPSLPVDPAGHLIDVLWHHAPKHDRERSLSPDEAKRRHAPLNSHHDGFRLLR